MKAIIKKDLMGIVSNKKMLTVLIVVPLVMAVVMPCVFIFSIVNSQADDLVKMLSATNLNKGGASQQYMLINLVINYIMPLFFMMIPISISSVMAASSFVGEKEKKTLETLLYSPLSLKDIFSAKILASFLLSMAACIFSFIVMLSVVQILISIFAESVVMPNINWLIMLLLIAPAASLISISLIVRGSAKARSSEESQQSSLLLILPLVLFIVGQFSGVMMMGTTVFLILGILMAIISIFVFRSAFRKFNYEALLR